MRLQIPIFGLGSIKIKSRDRLREVERERLPHWKFGGVYVIWWSRQAEKYMARRPEFAAQREAEKRPERRRRNRS